MPSVNTPSGCLRYQSGTNGQSLLNVSSLQSIGTLAESLLYKVKDSVLKDKTNDRDLYFVKKRFPVDP
jgi:hypothetical protein